MKKIYSLVMAITVVALVATSVQSSRKIDALSRQNSDLLDRLAEAKKESDRRDAAIGGVEKRLESLESFGVWLEGKTSRNFQIVGSTEQAKARAEADTLTRGDLWLPQDEMNLVSVKTGRQFTVSQPLTLSSVYGAALAGKRPVRFFAAATGVAKDALAVTDLVQVEHVSQWEWPVKDSGR